MSSVRTAAQIVESLVGMTKNDRDRRERIYDTTTNLQGLVSTEKDLDVPGGIPACQVDPALGPVLARVRDAVDALAETVEERHPKSPEAAEVAKLVRDFLDSIWIEWLRFGKELDAVDPESTTEAKRERGFSIAQHVLEIMDKRDRRRSR